MSLPLHFEFWCHVLVENGCTGGAVREERLANFLVQNHFTKLAQLSFADHPSEWLGAESLTPDELELVWSLRRVARKRSR